jgi:hypothetical protein
MLKIKNKHPRDDNIIFQEEGHLYFVNGDPNYISVTTVIHEFFPKFDSDVIIDKMQKSNKWTNSKYYGMTSDEIKKQWKDIAESAARLGTLLHESIENYYNNIEQNIDSEIEKEYNQFLLFKDEILKKYPNLEPYRTEWYVYHEDYRISGSIDMIFIDKQTQELYIFDWKRTSELKKENRWQTGFAPICHLDDCNYNQYSIQLNVYKFILESKYDKKVNSLYLVCFHPTNETFIIEPVFDLQKEVKNLLEIAYNQKLYLKNHSND